MKKKKRNLQEIFRDFFVFLLRFFSFFKKKNPARAKNKKNVPAEFSTGTFFAN